MNKLLKIHPKDNLIVALGDINAGESIVFEGVEYTFLKPVLAKHKFVATNVEKGDLLYQYGVLVAEATTNIAKGEAITVDNVKHKSEPYNLEGAVNNEVYWQKPDVSKFVNRTFNGYHRQDGNVGTLNNWLVIPLVFCENRNVLQIKEALESQLGFSTKVDYTIDTHKLINAYANGASSKDILEMEVINEQQVQGKNKLFPNVDGLKFITHDAGCGSSRNDSDALARLLAGYINNANVAGATVLSLGCQHTQASLLKEALEKQTPGFSKPLYVLEQQESKSEKEFIAEAVKKTFVGLVEANKIERKPAPLSKLVLGLECGASDGFSGITGNPALGYVSDVLAVLGGTSVLAEFPELNGVEQEMINRCTSIETAKRFKDLMDVYSQKAEEAGSGFYANPSPGNIKDGLITDAIKSAGAAKKGGTSPITDVLDYTEKITKQGLNLLCTPGNDVESTTALAGSGCNIMAFVTGLGTPTGNAVSPVIKVSSNTAIAEKMSDIIDFNAGGIVDAAKTIEQTGEELLELLIKVANGEVKTKAQLLGQDDFIPWKRGVSL